MLQLMREVQLAGAVGMRLQDNKEKDSDRRDVFPARGFVPGDCGQASPRSGVC
ncbi:MAG: hypothetical protein MZU91_01480 [Desulfosudis oleivorans]|nr:hypothetical protein [Desulfosudis oleivorans]